MHQIAIKSISGAIATTNVVLANAQNRAGNISIEAAGNLTLEAPGEVTRIGDISSAGAMAGQIKLSSGGTLLAKNIRILNRIAGDGIANGISLSGQSIVADKLRNFS